MSDFKVGDTICNKWSFFSCARIDVLLDENSALVSNIFVCAEDASLKQFLNQNSKFLINDLSKYDKIQNFEFKPKFHLNQKVTIGSGKNIYQIKAIRYVKSTTSNGRSEYYVRMPLSPEVRGTWFMEAALKIIPINYNDYWAKLNE